MESHKTAKLYTMNEVLMHKAKDDIFVVIRDKVYDVTSFLDEHPGGQDILLDKGGTDATEDFEEVEHSKGALEILSGLEIGRLKRQDGDSAPRSSINIGHRNFEGTTRLSGIKFYAIVLAVLFTSFLVYAQLKGE